MASSMTGVEKSVDRVLREAAVIERRAILKGLERIAQASPVYTGRYMRNHRVAVNSSSVELELFSSRDEAEMVANPVSRSVSQIISEEGAKLAKLRVTDNVIIGNAVPWAKDVESGTKTRPEGMQYQRGAQTIRERLRSAT